ncbi:MAG: glycogen-binding domain-containing protein [Proteobacteria bacterium]|nr:glycogen-binding domain-containing protein [Pseudomonadota bacterium]
MNIREPLISQFIDDELSLGEKRDFLAELARDPVFAGQALALVDQEILLDSDPVFAVEAPAMPAPRCLRFPSRSAMALALAAAMLLVSFGVLFRAHLSDAPKGLATVSHRFVLYRPDALGVEISGSFNGWTPVAMSPAGSSGYWEAFLDLPPGEHRFSYLVGPDGRVPDPTLLARENDGFGGENSILKVAGRI